MAAGAVSYPVRHPRWSLTYAGKDITLDVSAMMMELTYSDGHAHSDDRPHARSRAEGDSLEVTFEDRDRRWQKQWFPTRGDLVGALIGYSDSRLLDCGIFQVDELELQGPPDTFHFRCIAAGIKPSLRTPRSAGYENQTLLQVANTVAQRHRLTVVDAPKTVNVTWQRLTQSKETDLHFLRRLALAHDYDFAIRGSQLVFYSRTALEEKPSVLTVKRTQVKTFEFSQKTQGIYASASVAYHDPTTKKLVTGAATDDAVPTGDDLHIVARSENANQAQAKAAAALHDANMMQVSGRLQMEGTTLLVAGINLTISGFGNFDGDYHVETSKHQIDRENGYATEVEIRQL